MIKETAETLAEILSYQFQNSLELADVIVGLNDAFGTEGTFRLGIRREDGYLKVSFEGS